MIINKKRKLKFQQSWLNLFPWLTYSKIKQGGYCKYCVVFSKYGGVGNQPLGQLVMEPITNFKDALQVNCLFIYFYNIYILNIYNELNNNNNLN